MTNQPQQRRNTGAIPYVMLGAFIGSYAERRRRRPRKAATLYTNLTARQALAVARIANALGNALAIVLIAYYAYIALWLL